MMNLRCRREQREAALHRLGQLRHKLSPLGERRPTLTCDNVTEGNKSLAELARFFEALHEDRAQERRHDSSSLAPLQDSLTSINEEEEC